MSARLLRVLAAALLLGSYVHASGHAAPTARLTGVSTKTEGVGTTVVIETTAPVAYVAAQPDPLTLLVDLRNVSPGQVRPEKVSGAVAAVTIESSTDDEGTAIARVRLLLVRPMTPQVRSKWNTVIVELGGGAARQPVPASDPRPSVASEKPEPVVVRSAAAVPAAPAKRAVNPEAAAEPAPDVKAEPKAGGKTEPKVEPRPGRQAPPSLGARSQGQKPAPVGADGERQFTGHLVTFDFFQADLRSVLRTFSEISGLNVVIDPAIPAGTVDVSLREVPWDQALEVILRSHQLGYVLENNVVRIAPLKVLAQEETDRQKLVEAQAMGGQLKVFTKTLSYARAGDVAKLLKDTRVISSRGSALVDERTNTLIINDLPESLVDCESLIAVLDRAEAQVEIEAKIVQTSSDTARALGVQWGVNGRMASELANTAPVAFPAQSSVSGRTNAVQGNPVGAAKNNVPAAVNLPATGATSALGISMGTLTGSFNLDVALSALEKKGQGKILSQPKVMMQNNFEAEMTQGVQIPIQTVSNNTVTVTFKDAALTLKVKPQITASNTVMMSISLENASPDYSRQVNGIPPIDTQRAVTQVLVNDAETMVIGGIMKSQETTSREGVPGLSRIPLLGWLFRRDTMSGDLRELLIFITPRIRR
jgi:type IV pilus assembly protein PilQ